MIVIHNWAYIGMLGMAILQETDGYFDKARINVKVGPRCYRWNFRNVVRCEIRNPMRLEQEITDELDSMDQIYDASATNTDVYSSI